MSIIGPLAAVLAAAFLQETAIAIVRITTSYRSLELNLSMLQLGVVNAAYAILPILLAVKIGRIVDYGHETLVCRLSAGVIMLSCFGISFFPSLAGLIAFTALFGVSFLGVTVGLQVICARIATTAELERVIGGYMAANAIGQAVGAFIVGVMGGNESVPATSPLFWAAIVTAALLFGTSMVLKIADRDACPVRTPMPSMKAIFDTPGFRMLFVIAVVCLAATDLILIYLPILGGQRNIAAEIIGALLTVRAISSLLARLAFSSLSAFFGSYRLLSYSCALAAISCAILAMPVYIAVMFVAIAVAGFCLSIATTIAVTRALAIVPRNGRGIATSLRMIGNRVSQFVFPLIAAVIATIVGAGGVFIVTSVAVAGCGFSLSRSGKAQK